MYNYDSQSNLDMKHFLLFLFVLTPFLCVAQKVDSKINDVTVYKNGALVSRSANVSLKKGDNELTLVNLSTELDPKSIRLGVGNSDVTIVSLLHEFDIETSPEIAELRDKNASRKAIISDSLSILKSEMDVLCETRSLIVENKKIGGNLGITSEQLAKMAQFFKTELTNIETQYRRKLLLTEKYKMEQNTILQNEQNISKDASKKVSRIKLKLSAAKDLNNVNINLSYLVFDAKWTPYYEVRVSDADQPLMLVYKARVSQNSNEKWNNVKLTLSTGDPSLESQKPQFETMFLPPVIRKTNSKNWKRPTSNLVFGRVCDEYGEPLPGVSVIENGTSNGTVSDFFGNFKLEMLDINNKLTFSFIGFESTELEPGEKMQVYLKESIVALEEVVVVGYGSQKKATLSGVVVSVDSKKNNKRSSVTSEIPLDIKNSLTVNEFQIQIPYTIPDDGKDYNVSMLTYSIPADYKYSSSPRFNKEVFLMAEIPELYQYSLLEGDATIYYQNIYQGESKISLGLADDTLKLSIGSDKMLAIDRQEIHSKTNKAMIGSSCKVQKTFEIALRNNKNFAVDIDLEDQYPIAKYSDIKVTLTDNGGADVNTQNGRLGWKIHLEPHESKKVQFSYEVKYPKNQYNFNVE